MPTERKEHKIDVTTNTGPWVWVMGLPVGLSCFMVATVIVVIVLSPFVCCGCGLLLAPFTKDRDQPAYRYDQPAQDVPRR